MFLDFYFLFYLIIFIFLFLILINFVRSNSLTNVSSFKKFFKISKKNRNMVVIVLYIYVTLVFCPYLDDIFNNTLNNDPFFFTYVAFFGLCFNFLNSKHTCDYKFVSYSFLKIFNYANLALRAKLILVVVNKFVLFFYKNILLVFFKVCEKLYKYVSKTLVSWIPLFKKSSYFAFFKSFISKFK